MFLIIWNILILSIKRIYFYYNFNAKKGCGQQDGKCLECIDGYYKNKTWEDCTCDYEDKYTSCIDGKYGINQCKEQYSEHCESESCEIEKGKCKC